VQYNSIQRLVLILDIYPELIDGTALARIPLASDGEIVVVTAVQSLLTVVGTIVTVEVTLIALLEVAGVKVIVVEDVIGWDVMVEVTVPLIALLEVAGVKVIVVEDVIGWDVMVEVTVPLIALLEVAGVKVTVVEDVIGWATVELRPGRAAIASASC